MSNGEHWVSFEELSNLERGRMKMAHDRGRSVHFDGHEWFVKECRPVDKRGRVGRWFVLVPSRSGGGKDGGA